MKKLLLTAAAAMSCAFMANAYTVDATAEIDASYDAWGYTLLGTNDIKIEINDDYVILKDWLEVAGEDLRLDYNEDGDVTAIIPIVDGVEGTPDLTMADDGLVGIDTSNPNYNYFFLYIDYCGVSVDPENEDGCYVILYGAGYDGEWEEIQGYFNWVWGEQEEEPQEPWYIVESKASEDPDWTSNYDGFFAPENTVQIAVYDDNSVMIKGWTGNENDMLYVEFDDDENVTDIAMYDAEGNEVSESMEYEGYLYVNGTITNDDYYYVQFIVAEGYDYAYANAEEGYVIVSGYFYKNQEEYDWLYYNIEWPYQENGIASVATNDGPAVYYNLNGVRVDNPTAAGLYIKRQGNKATKVAIR